MEKNTVDVRYAENAVELRNRCNISLNSAEGYPCFILCIFPFFPFDLSVFSLPFFFCRTQQFLTIVDMSMTGVSEFCKEYHML